MGWRFWRRRSSEVEQTVEVDTATEAASLIEPPPRHSLAPAFQADAIDSSLDEFRLDLDRETLPPVEISPLGTPSAAAIEEVADVAAVVRRKGTRRTLTSPTAIHPAERGCRPIWVPSLREHALLYRLAADSRAESEPETAANLWHAYVDLCPDDGEAWFSAGQCLLARRDWAEAQTAFEAAHRLMPDHAGAAGALGFMAGTRGDAEEAVAHYRAAVDRAPRDIDLWTALAEAQEAASMREDAVASRRRILEITGG